MNIQWIISPVAGAVIGYFTNWIAIKMLFRPHTEKRLFGIKLPFTPGLIPKEKHRLSKKIGQTLAKNVLTESELVDAVTSPAVMDKLTALLNEVVENFKCGLYDERIDQFCGSIAEKLSATITDEDGYVNKALSGFAERFEDSGIIYKIIDSLRNNEHKIRDFTPDDLPEKLMLYMNKKTPDFITFLKELPERYPDVDEALGRMIHKIAEDNFGQLLGIFIKYDQLYDKIKASIFSYLEDSDNTRIIALRAAAYLDGLLRKSVGELFGKIPGDTITNIAERINDKSKDLSPSALILRFIPEPAVLIKSLLKAAVNTAAARLDDEGTAKLHSFAGNTIKTLVSKGGAYIVSSIRFDELVENKINSFSTAEAEDMILSIVNRELKAITALGGILGFVIGFGTIFINMIGG